MSSARRAILLALALALAGCGRAAAIESEGESNLFALRRCSSDSDCTLAPSDCCGCARGGEDQALRVDAVQALAARFDCANATCNAQPNPKCGGIGASCMSGLCVMSPNR